MFVYDLPPEFREEGTRDCSSQLCSFGPNHTVEGYTLHDSDQWDLQWMILRRLMNSPRRTTNVSKADLFFVPAFARGWAEAVGRGVSKGCGSASKLHQALLDQNHLLRANDTGVSLPVARRHILIDFRCCKHCGYMESVDAKAGNDGRAPSVFDVMARVVMEKRGNVHPPTGPQTNNHVVSFSRRPAYPERPFHLYAVPYPSSYHGSKETSPSVTRTRGKAAYLWSSMQGNHGMMHGMRKAMFHECKASPECEEVHPRYAYSAAHGRRGCNATGGQGVCAPKAAVNESLSHHRHPTHGKSRGTTQSIAIAESMLASTFCANLPGDTITRKGLLDAITWGCIPILGHQSQRGCYPTHATPAEFESISVLLPHDVAMGKKMGTWASESEQDAAGKSMAKRETVGNFLNSFMADEIKQKQDALAKIAPRFTLGVADTPHDMLDILLRRLLADAHRVTAEGVFEKELGTRRLAALNAGSMTTPGAHGRATLMLERVHLAATQTTLNDNVLRAMANLHQAKCLLQDLMEFA